VQTAFAQPSGHPEAPDWARYSALHFSSQLQHLLWMLGAGLLWLLLGSMSWFRSSATRRWFLRAGVFALVALDLLVAARHINPSFPQDRPRTPRCTNSCGSSGRRTATAAAS
jgi:hypothetical protein